ncbi:hypothetical protein [Chelativorans alearense]|uniref:hypothetical protein n=1 Tax=Chelativorans alearense TaxID=2681495 RepID=UPI0013D47745|nr:hypothetical protein [Chelativorans alearense]
MAEALRMHEGKGFLPGDKTRSVPCAGGVSPLGVMDLGAPSAFRGVSAHLAARVP